MKGKVNVLHLLLSVILLFGVLFPATASAEEASSESQVEKKTAPFTNLALGKPYTILQGFYDSELAGYENRTSRDNGTEYELTDGKIATSFASDPYCGCDVYFLDKNWIGFARQVSRSVVIDLGDSKFIRSISSGFLQERTAAVELPRYIRFYLSDDGIQWHVAGEHKTELIAASQTPNRQVLGLDHINVSARYVKMEFEVSMFAFADEIEVIGSNSAGGRPVRTLPKAEEPVDIPLPTVEESGGVRHMYITYLYPEQTGNGHLGKWTRDDFKHVITHLDSSGQPDGWMFDTVLALSASGGSDYRTDYQQQQSWQAIIDRLFVKQSETVPPYDITNSYLMELEEAMEAAQIALGDQNRKTKLVVGIPFPDPSSAKWGTIDGVELNFDPSDVGEDIAYRHRVKAVEWFIDQVVDRFEQAGYNNVELAGFYWIHEEVSFQTKHDEKLIKTVADIIHSKNRKFYWIPFYMSNGTNFWKELGFDVAMMQPNYYFNSNLTPNQTTGKLDLSRLRNSIAASKRLGLSVEVEGDYHMSWKGWAPDYDGQLYNDEYSRRKYFAYLNELKNVEMDQGPLAYYLGAKTVLKDIVNDPREEVRKTYNETHKFISGTFQPVEIPEHDIPMPAGDSWTNPIMLEAEDGFEYTYYFNLQESKWLKFPIQAGEDWKVTLTPLNGANVSMETRHDGPTQTPHSGFSYGKPGEVQSMLVRNPGSSADAIMLRVFPDGEKPGGQFKITLSQPVEDGTSMMNAMELPNASVIEGTAEAGQEIWYKIAGNKQYDLALVPNDGSDFALQLYWDANSGAVQAHSDQPAGENETIHYNNIFSNNFLFYVKVIAKTSGSFALYNGVLPPEQPPVRGMTFADAIVLNAQEGVVYDSATWNEALSPDGAKWLKFPVEPGEEWEILLTPGAGSEVAMETRWVEHQLVGYTYSWMSVEKDPQTLTMKNDGTGMQYAVIRTLARNAGGNYTISLKKLGPIN